MIIDKLDKLGSIISGEDFKELIKDLNRYVGLEKGTYPVNDRLLVKRVKSKTKFESDAKIESHRYHMDIQIPLDISELYYIYDCCDVEANTEYDEINDVIFYGSSKKRKEITVNPGEFILLDVNEVHQPQIELNSVRSIEKIVIKVKK